MLQYDVTPEAGPDSYNDFTNGVGGATGVPSPRVFSRTRPGNCRSLELLEAGLAVNPGLDSGPGLDQVLFRGSLEEFLLKTHTTVIYPQSPEELTDLAEDSCGLLLCPFCERGFRRLSALKEHLTSSHNIFADEPLMNQVQSQRLHRTSPHQMLAFADVTGNRNLNTDVTGNRKFKCSECGKAFKYKHHLKEHLRIHSGEKPYECSNCKKRFSHSGSYSSHISSRKCTANNNNSANPANNAHNNHPKNSGQTRPDPLQFTDHRFLSSPQNGFEHFYSNGKKEVFSYSGNKMSTVEDEVSKLRAHLKEIGANMEDANRNIIGFQLDKDEKPLMEEIGADSEPNSAPFLCQFCKESFPSPIPLHQHERYLCKLSAAMKDALEPTENRKSPTLALKEQSDSGHFSDREHFGEHFSLLKTNVPINSEPNPEEILRISLAVGLPQEIIREWFLQQQNGAKKYKKSEFPSVNALFATDSVDFNVNGASINRKPSPFFMTKSSSGERRFETINVNSNKDVLKQNPSLFGSKSRSVELRSTTPSPLNLSNSSKNSFTSEEPHLDFPLDLSLPKVHRPGPCFGYGLELEGTTTVFPGFLGPFSGPGPRFMGSLSEVGAYHKMDTVFLSNLELGAFSKPLQRRKNQRRSQLQDNSVDGSTYLLDNQSEESLRQKESGSYNCDLCHKTFQKTSSLLRHRYEHTGKRPHQCGVCQKAFKHKHHLLEHSRLHSGEKPYVCDRCGKRFSHSGSYSQHMNHRYAYCRRDQNQDQSQKDQNQDQKELKEQKDEQNQGRDQEQRGPDQREQSTDKDQEQSRRSSEGDLYLFKEKPTDMDGVKVKKD